MIDGHVVAVKLPRGPINQMQVMILGVFKTSYMVVGDIWPKVSI